MLRLNLPAFICLIFCAGLSSAQHLHQNGSSPAVAPKIYLDKSPRIVEYQLKRLSNEQLLLVERAVDDPKYLPVFQAILTREGMSQAYRDEALDGLVKLNDSAPTVELARALLGLASGDPSVGRTVKSLASMLLSLPGEALQQKADTLLTLVDAREASLSSVGYAALLTGGLAKQAWAQAEHAQQVPSLLDSIGLIPVAAVRASLHQHVHSLIGEPHSLPIRRAALDALAHIPTKRQETFRAAAELLPVPELRSAAVRAMLSVPVDARETPPNLEVIDWLVKFAEMTPAAERTEASFLDAMELVDQLISQASPGQAKTFRERLRETVVRVVRIHTVEEEMRYDLPYFAVEAGRPVQVVLINEDLMPHNLVVTVPGALQEVADQGLAVGPDGGLDGKQYVPPSEKVLFATHMIPAGAQEALTFTAPDQPGEYPYVCTFPRHWMRMYGVMVVVEDLDAWLSTPVIPKDPIGSNRHFVQSWTVDDFREDMMTGLRGRTERIGEKLFVEASCAQCHKLGAIGVGHVGPDLGDVFARWKGDTEAVLREILDPSHRIDDKYAVHLIQTVDGLTVSGLIVEETNDQVALMENPEAASATVIPKENIEQRVKTSNSMMPKGLLDRYSQDEIFEILALIRSAPVAVKSDP